MIFIQVREKSGKTPCLVLIIFINSLHCCSHSGCSICHQKRGNFIFIHRAIAGISTSSIYKAPFCLPISVNVWARGQGESRCFWLSISGKSGNSQGIFIHVLGMNLVWFFHYIWMYALSILFLASNEVDVSACMANQAHGKCWARACVLTSDRTCL